MNRYLGFTLLLLTGFLYFESCKCKVECAAFDVYYMRLMPYKPSDTIHFINNQANIIDFFVDSVASSPAFEEDGMKSELGCSSRNICHSGAGLAAHGSASRNNDNTFLLSLNRDTGSDNYLSGVKNEADFALLGTGFSFQFEPDLNANAKTDTILNSLTLGGRPYSNVLCLQIDTLESAYYSKRMIWKVYLDNDHGLIGFHDRQTQSIFYLK